MFHSKNQSIKELWSTTDDIRIFLPQCNKIDLFVCNDVFDERETRNERRFDDKFAPLRNIMEMFSAKCRSN